ncbi:MULTISPECIES: LysR family transcriptional regulator [Paraburkholderia]|uniref:LysR family transcriptional regulator n=1 Tax=Paraburkholderia madseniana TaxID=2599607 RepID=A0AAP5ET41_9BURK|nr:MULTISPECIES: LysR family transcriptional regulator [Paraburkholderia]MCX4145003.1 LysR family transcriptional regulator [Paraburkholderia madseniana]MDN7147955.1 LysR family transcriptional regulator [Paraburkholderia sp. WS6]MDQ6406835.1 LysR family transcriptional regulator [Paraburkholderia madseniana]
MDRLQAMKVFTRVVETSSFSRAAEALDLPRASVSNLVQNLEAYLKVRLLQRTTRQVRLTSDGAAYYERCVSILADVEETESSLLNSFASPRGKLRVDIPVALGKLIVMPRLFEFHARYPDIELMVGFGDKRADLIQDGVDCVIRIGTLQDSSLVARRIGIFERVTVASPAYLQLNGTPQTLKDLDDHVAVNYFLGRTGRMMDMTFVVDSQTVGVKMRGNIAVNDAEAYVTCGLNGVGLLQAPRFMALPHLRSGELVEVLSQWKPSPMPISAVYPHNRHLSPTLRVLVDWLSGLFGEYPLFSGRQDSEEQCLPTVASTSFTRRIIGKSTEAIDPIA